MSDVRDEMAFSRHCPLSLCHIGLVKDQDGHPINHPHLLVIDKCWKKAVGNKISTVRKIEHGDETLKRKCLCTQSSGSGSIEDNWSQQKR